jgi:DNA-binding NtrC family response regulator
MGNRVLVVDDDQIVNKSFERVLTNKGYSVRTAMSGREAFEKFDGKDFDMVFTDLKMPGEDGLEVARRLKEMNPWLPIVVVTGYGTQEAEDRARKIGVAEFLQKPLSPTMIEDVAARVSASTATATATATAAATATEAAPAVAAKKESVAKNVALFFAAPFIGLAYIIAFPFVGVWMIAKQGARLASGKK